MADDYPSSDKTPPSGLTLIGKMLQSRSLSTPTSPAKASAMHHDTKRDSAMDIRHTASSPPSKPQRPAPNTPMESPAKRQRMPPSPPAPAASVDSQDIYDAPPLKHRRAGPSTSKDSARRPGRLSVVPQASETPSPMERAGNRMSEVYDKVRNAIFPPLVHPGTDSEDEEKRDRKGEYMMSGGLQGNDMSERERNGKSARKSPRKTRSLKDVQDDDCGEDSTRVDAPLLGDHAEKDEVKDKDEHAGERGHRRGSKRGEKKEIKVKRKHARTTIGDNGRVFFG